MVELTMISTRNDLESMGVSGLRETVLGRANEACCGDCRFLCEEKGMSTHPCAMGHGRKDIFSRFAMICPAFRLTPGIDDELEHRSGGDRRKRNVAVAAERRSGQDRRMRNTYCSRLVLPQSHTALAPAPVATTTAQ